MEIKTPKTVPAFKELRVQQRCPDAHPNKNKTGQCVTRAGAPGGGSTHFQRVLQGSGSLSTRDWRGEGPAGAADQGAAAWRQEQVYGTWPGRSPGLLGMAWKTKVEGAS